MRISGELLFQVRMVADGGPSLPDPAWVLVACLPRVGDEFRLPSGTFRVSKVGFDAAERSARKPHSAQFSARPVIHLTPAV